jgi:hypothetical protein
MRLSQFAEKLSYATGITDDVSKFLFLDKLLSRLDVIPYFVGRALGGNLARSGAQDCATTANGEFHVRSANTIGLRTECRRQCWLNTAARRNNFIEIST